MAYTSPLYKEGPAPTSMTKRKELSAADIPVDVTDIFRSTEPADDKQEETEETAAAVEEQAEEASDVEPVEETEADSPTPPSPSQARPRLTVDMPEWLQDEIRSYAERQNIGPSDAVCYLAILGMRADSAGLGRMEKYNARSLKFAFHVDLDPSDLDKPLKT